MLKKFGSEKKNTFVIMKKKKIYKLEYRKCYERLLEIFKILMKIRKERFIIYIAIYYIHIFYISHKYLPPFKSSKSHDF